MIRVALPLAFVGLAVVAIGVAISGCRPEPSSSANGSTVSRPSAPPTPEERFRQVVNTFRSAVDTNASGAQAGFLYRDEDGHSSLSIRSDVSDELIPPSKEGEPYRGIITVKKQFSYSLRIPAAESGDGKSDGKGQDGGSDLRGLDDESQDDSGVDVLDPNLMAAATKSEAPLPVQSDEVVARRSDENVRSYELVYENDRWVLKTKLDPETEQSIQYAFEHALDVQ
jgi:hypothetical protein